MPKIITTNNGIEITKLSQFYDGDIPFMEFLCLWCKKPKIARWHEVMRGVGLHHRGCANEKRHADSIDSFDRNVSHVTNCVRAKMIYSAKKRNINFELTIQDVKGLIFNCCAYCGANPEQLISVGRLKFNGIDRVDNNLGYTKNNCVPCCAICNMAKHKRSRDEFMKWIKRVAIFNIDMIFGIDDTSYIKQCTIQQ